MIQEYEALHRLIDGLPAATVARLLAQLQAELAPVEVREVLRGQTALRFRRPLVLMPSLDEESHEWMVLRDEDLNIHIVGQTRAELLEELNRFVVMLWEEYAMASEECLSPAALSLRSRLRDAIEEISVAPV